MLYNVFDIHQLGENIYTDKVHIKWCKAIWFKQHFCKSTGDPFRVENL